MCSYWCGHFWWTDQCDQKNGVCNRLAHSSKLPPSVFSSWTCLHVPSPSDNFLFCLHVSTLALPLLPAILCKSRWGLTQERPLSFSPSVLHEHIFLQPNCHPISPPLDPHRMEARRTPQLHILRGTLSIQRHLLNRTKWSLFSNLQLDCVIFFLIIFVSV